MSGFSPDWLSLREAADKRARNGELADNLRSWFLMRPSIFVVDLGCGTGANLRATAPLLPDSQRWTLVDNDPVLLSAARDALCVWADRSAPSGDKLTLTKGTAQIEVTFLEADLATGLAPLLSGAAPDLITASALFDLASAGVIGRFAAAAARSRAAVYATLSYNGRQGWTPRRPIDQQMLAAFHGHQMADKGLGIAAGPTAAIELSEALTAHGYSVTEGTSPWRLGAGDQALVTELATGFARAVRETRAVPAAEIDAWLALRHTAAEVGHTDILALPRTGMTGSDEDED